MTSLLSLCIIYSSVVNERTKLWYLFMPMFYFMIVLWIPLTWKDLTLKKQSLCRNKISVDIRRRWICPSCVNVRKWIRWTLVYNIITLDEKIGVLKLCEFLKVRPVWKGKVYILDWGGLRLSEKNGFSLMNVYTRTLRGTFNRTLRIFLTHDCLLHGFINEKLSILILSTE